MPIVARCHEIEMPRETDRQREKINGFGKGIFLKDHGPPHHESCLSVVHSMVSSTEACRSSPAGFLFL